MSLDMGFEIIPEDPADQEHLIISVVSLLFMIFIIGLVIYLA